jgi:Putative transposase of IS4/5 family (DUF4096)
MSTEFTAHNLGSILLIGDSRSGGVSWRAFVVSDRTCAGLEPLLPCRKPGNPRVNDRRVISGILHVLEMGCRWRASGISQPGPALSKGLHPSGQQRVMRI